jgi:hypothetical protein
MNMQEVRVIAKNYKIDSVGMSKIDIIHRVQREEGNFDCYGTAYSGVCDQANCKWREDCFEASQG